MAKNAYAKKMTADFEALKYAIRKETMQQVLDYVTIALGRLGVGEKRMTDFERVLTEVMMDYSNAFLADLKDDKEMWYAKQKLDDELKRYCGSRFEPFEVRYYT